LHATQAAAKIINRKVVVGLLLLASVYCPAALVARLTFIPRDPTILGPHFLGLGENGYISYQFISGTEPDEVGGLAKSRVQLYEDGRPLGPAHSDPKEVSHYGKGRFTHQRESGRNSIIIFSTSDNSSPNTNARTYRAVVSTKQN
jgi:hypothetical protein